jgi:hypothetical protein
MRVHPYDLMTGAAGIGLFGSPENRIAGCVTDVTTRAGDLVGRVRTGMPARAEIRLVAGRAHRVLRRHRCRRIGAESHDRRAFLTLGRTPRMQAAGTVARFALQLVVTEGSVRIGRDAMRPAKDRQSNSIVVAAQAGVCAAA